MSKINIKKDNKNSRTHRKGSKSQTNPVFLETISDRIYREFRAVSQKSFEIIGEENVSNSRENEMKRIYDFVDNILQKALYQT